MKIDAALLLSAATRGGTAPYRRPRSAPELASIKFPLPVINRLTSPFARTSIGGWTSRSHSTSAAQPGSTAVHFTVAQPPPAIDPCKYLNALPRARGCRPDRFGRPPNGSSDRTLDYSEPAFSEYASGSVVIPRSALSTASSTNVFMPNNRA